LYGPATGYTVLILFERLLSCSVRVREETVGVQYRVAEKLVCAAVELVSAGFGRQVDDAPGVAPVFGAVAVGLNAELSHSIRTRHHVDEVSESRVRRNSVEIDGALVREAASDLVITRCKD